MPVLNKSTYKAPFLFRNAYFSTIYTALLRQKASISFKRERVSTPDGDFLDLDLSFIGSNKLVVVCHGLEGSTDNSYVTNATKYLNENNFDVCALNYRGCSGEPNCLIKSYHSGKTEDLDLVINKYLEEYDEIYLLGFSVGGNICLKYLGDEAETVDPKIKKAACLSVPVSLRSCAIELAKPENYIYMKNFLLKLEEKMKIKEEIFPGEISTKNFHKIKNFKDYDARYTALLNGYKSAEDYWAKASSLPVLEKIKIPALLVNALDDPFLGEECFPYEAARQNENFILECPRYGGHLGFTSLNIFGKTWQEKRVLEFFQN